MQRLTIVILLWIAPAHSRCCGGGVDILDGGEGVDACQQDDDGVVLSC